MREVRHDEGHTWQRTSVVDEEAIDHERIIAEVQATGEIVRVRVAQRKDFDLLADPVTVVVSPPRITVGLCIEITGPKALELGDGLHEAGRFAAEVDSGGPDERSVEVIPIAARARRPRVVAEM
jgi:hypothetical protein